MNRAQAQVIVMPRPVRRVLAAEEVREGSTGRVVRRMPCALRGPRPGPRLVVVAPQVVFAPRPVQLEQVWAVAEELVQTEEEQEQPVRAQSPDLAFYRKYTEGLLRRYLRMSLTAGRVPSVMGREMFQGNVTHCRTHTMEDVVIFCMDMESRLALLQPMEQRLITRITLQNYSQGETASMMGLSLRGVVRHYGEALDRLTAMLLDAGMLERLKSCQ